MGFDIKATPSAECASEVGYTFEPLDPKGRPIGATITVVGVRSRQVREHARRQYARAQAREVAARKRGKDADPLTLDEIDESLTETAIVYTAGWEGFERDGQPLPFSPEAARELYTAHPWLRDRVIAEGQDLGNFIRPSSASSSSTPPPSSGST